MKIIGLIVFRNEERFLPGCLDHLAPHVDEILCLDNCSIDGSYDIALLHPSVAGVLREETHSQFHFKERENRSRLLGFAKERGADFVLCLDADERSEEGFLKTIRKAIRVHGQSIYNISFRDLWNSPDAYRCDGQWNLKTKTVMFPLIDRSLEMRPNRIHSPWVPAAFSSLPTVLLQANFYHLRSLKPEDRLARMMKFKAIDPKNEWQSIGYDYLCDESGLKLEKVPNFADYRRTQPDLERVFL